MSRSRKSRRGGSSRGSQSNPIGKFLFAIFVLAAIVAVYDIPYDPGAKGIYEIAVSKSKNAEAWAKNIGPSIADRIGRIIAGGGTEPTYDGGKLGGNGSTWTNSDGNTGGTGTPPGTAPSDSGKASEVDKLKTGEAQNVAYDRDEWNHWISVRSCWDVRKEVLARDAVPGSLVLQDKNGKETTDVKKACNIVSGKWIDPYSGVTITDPKGIDIDHVIPLKYTATHGGQAWSKKKKEEYANSLSYSGHLLATSAKENRTKSDKGPSKYQPKDKSYYCAYGTEWMTIANNWGLTVDKADKAKIKEMVATCK